MFKGISFFGIIHQSGGCGPELLGALDLLQSKGVPVRCIVPIGDPVVRGDRSKYLNSRGVEVIEYRPGLFSESRVLMSFGEHLCFNYMKTHSDRSPWVVWSSCMSWAIDREVEAHSEGLIDEFYFQTERTAKKVASKIEERSVKPVFYRSGYFAYIHPISDYAQPSAFVDKNQREFRVCKAVRDDAEKWHQDTWRMFCGVGAPKHKTVQIEIAGWGNNARDKIGNPCDPTSKWSGLFDIILHEHITSPLEMAKLYGRSHVLLHYYPFVESYGFATLQAMIAKCVPIGAPEGGFLDLIKHGETGFLATSPDEAAYYTSKLAFEDATWKKMSEAAAKWVVEEGPGNPDKCWPWWEELLKKFEISF
jgi:glycosyltransferase involved in cell wall biosynthesis